MDASTFDVGESKEDLCYHKGTRNASIKKKIGVATLKADDSLLIKEDVNDEYTQEVYIYTEFYTKQ